MSLQFVLAFTDLISKNVMKKSTPSLFDSFDINKTSISKKTYMKNSIKSIGAFVLFLLIVSHSSFVNAQKVDHKLLNNVSVQESSPLDIRTHSERDMRLPKPANSDVVSNQGREDEYSRPGSSVELIDKRTEFSRTMKNTDGSFSQTTSQLPMHYMNNGTWMPIDVSLEKINEENSPYSFRNESNSLKTYLPKISTGQFISNFRKIRIKKLQTELRS